MSITKNWLIEDNIDCFNRSHEVDMYTLIDRIFAFLCITSTVGPKTWEIPGKTYQTFAKYNPEFAQRIKSEFKSKHIRELQPERLQPFIDTIKQQSICIGNDVYIRTNYGS